MRILHVGKYLPPVAGGMETFLADLASAQADIGHTVHCLVHRRRETPLLAPAGTTASASLTLGHLLYAPIAPGFPLHLERQIRATRPDVLHLHLPNTSAFFCLASPAARALPWVIHWHSDVETLPRQRLLRAAYRLYRHLEQAMLRRARLIIATSPDYLAASKPLLAHQQRCHVVPLGIATARLGNKSAPPKHWPEQHLRLLALGRLSHYKGFEHLIEAVANSTRVSLTLVGDGEQRETLNRQIERLGLAARVQLLGNCDQPQVNALLESCDVLCLPSIARSEAFGMTLLEAMAMGKPVLASDLAGSGMPWVVRQAGHGLLAQPGDAVSLAACILQLQDGSLRQSLGKNGALALAKQFRIEAVAEQIDPLYHRLVPTDRLQRT